MALARGALETVAVRVIGEVSEFNDKPGYKAAYFTVCDEGAAMPCMMWRDAYAASGVQLRCGALVEMSGAFSAYIPKGRVIGLSKIPRLVDVFARRLQVQERLTNQIADVIRDKVNPLGVAVVMEGTHLCMAMRGVEKQNSFAVTSAMHGVFRDDARTRSEFLELIRQR